jgi:signal transduction histidine kinase/ActR/RegA family two-component response regulator
MASHSAQDTPNEIMGPDLRASQIGHPTRHGIGRFTSRLISPGPTAIRRLRGPQRSHRVLILACIVLPMSVLAVGSYFAWRAAVETGLARLGRTIDVAHENAARVFETYKLLLGEADDPIADLSDVEIGARERELHERLAAMIATLPQAQDLQVFDVQGHPLVSARVYPVPHDVSVADQDFFRNLPDARDNLTIGSLQVDRLDHEPSFDVAVPWISRAGVFRGGLAVSVNPAYFQNYWRRNELADETPAGMTMVLFRSDGAFLARWPQPIRIGSGVRASPSFHAKLATNPDAGAYKQRFPDDGIFRMLAYRRVDEMPLYVVASLRRSSITERWLSTMAEYLYFGVPATLALVSLAVAAARRARRESEALALLRVESQRREQAEAAFRQAQKMEAIGRLTGGIAHDFNNLLTAISGSVEYLVKAIPTQDDRTRRYAAMARESVQRAATLTHRLLAFSRQQALETKSVNLNRLVAGMSELLRRTLGEDVQIETVLAGGLWPTESDPNQLENTLLNLAINARDAMPDGGKLTIETLNAHLDASYAAAHAEVEPGQYVQLAVTDTGCGMTPEIVGKVFEPFFTTKPAGKGTGLGMSMVYGFVKQSRGHIKIYSEVGRGTTVKIYLPRSPQSAELPPDLSEAPPRPPQSHGETVLVVEDDDAVRGLSVATLQELGYRVISARDAAAALDLLRGNPDVRLLFTDVVLPGSLNGRRLAEQACILRPGLPVLFTTGYTPNAIIHNGVLDSGVHLLSKPFSAAELGAKIAAMLAAVRQARDMP